MADFSDVIGLCISLLAMLIAAIGFFYRIGRDSRDNNNRIGKLDQLVDSTNKINDKLDKIADWQREAASIHSSHSEQIKTLFNRVGRVEESVDSLGKRMEDRSAMIIALQKILERLEKNE